ncbi:MAG: FtsQ-type POTRA domain-containing protein [Myxococcales bacterium]|nr:FtsQ-type POTRA domain-containing protein [Myxococcales bacterium]
MRPSAPARDRRPEPPKNRRVAAVKPRTVAAPQRKPAVRAVASGARPNRRVDGPRAARSEVVKRPRRSRRAALGALVARLRALPRPSLGPRARRLIGAGVRLGVALVLAWGLLLGVQQGYQFVTTSTHFEAKSVVFSPTAHVSSERLLALMGLESGTNILAVDVDAMRAKIEADPWVASASVQRELPDTLRVAVVEHEAAAVLHAGHFYLLSEAGVPFKRVEPGERGTLPVVTGVAREQLIAGHPEAAAGIRRALEVLGAYQQKARPRLGEVHVGDGGEAVLYSEKTGTMLRLGRGPLGDKLDRYDALRAALGARADKLSVVHLDAAGPDGGERVIASFTDAAEADALLAQAVKKPAAERPAAALAEPPHKPEKPAPRKKQAKSGKPGPHKFASGIPRYD